MLQINTTGGITCDVCEVKV